MSEYSNVTFNENTAGQDSGAIHFNDLINIRFDNPSAVTLTSNIADDYGGVIYSKITQNTKYSISISAKLTSVINNGGWKLQKVRGRGN